MADTPQPFSALTPIPVAPFAIGDPQRRYNIRLFSGVYFDPFDPTPEAVACVTWADIAWGLANTSRFAGHTAAPISVGAHTLCVLSAARRLARPDCGHATADAPAEVRALDREVAIAALLHDASEAILGDIPTPFKRHPAYAGVVATEDALQAALNVRFGAAPDAHHHPAVAEADRFALAIEAWFGHGVDVREWGYAVPERWHALRDMVSVAMTAPYDWSQGRGGYTSSTHENFVGLLTTGCAWGLCTMPEMASAMQRVDAAQRKGAPAPWWPEGGAP